MRRPGGEKEKCGTLYVAVSHDKVRALGLPGRKSSGMAKFHRAKISRRDGRLDSWQGPAVTVAGIILQTGIVYIANVLSLPSHTCTYVFSRPWNVDVSRA